MKLFSWSALFFVLSLAFIWSCGYWIWLQSTAWQLQQQKSELNLQLDKTQTVLQNWQQSYQVHLAYLATKVAESQPILDQSLLLEPGQDIDNKLQQALWPDPLIGYALLDQAGRVQRFSSAEAGQLFNATQLNGDSSQNTLPPLVFNQQWVLPLDLPLSGQRLILWFDGAELKLQLQQQLLSQIHSTEFLLVGQQAQLWSHSKQQNTLLARLGGDNITASGPLQFYLKRPPEDLLRSRQKYENSRAWPDTELANQMRRHPQGFIATPYLNYLGRPTIAVWRWSESWQADLVIERDATMLLKEQQQWQQFIGLGLLLMTLFFSSIFFFIQRRLHQKWVEPEFAEQTDTEQWQEPTFEPPHFSALPDVAIASSQQPATSDAIAEPALPVAQTTTEAEALVALLSALSSQPGADPRLNDISQQWLAQQQERQAELPVAIELRQPVATLVRRLAAQNPAQELVLDMAADLPQWLQFPLQSWIQVLEVLLQLSMSRAEGSATLIKLLFAEQQLRVEICDNGQSLTDGQWLRLLHPAAADNSDIATQFKSIQPHLISLSAQLSATSEPFIGNKIVLNIAVQVLDPLRHAQPSIAPDLNGHTALLLCPSGETQQVYRRMLRATALSLVPLDDAAQFMQWCTDQSQPALSYLLLDDHFIAGDIQMGTKVIELVRRYFPSVKLLVVSAKPEQWQASSEDFSLRIIAKPLLPDTLYQGLIQETAGVLMPQQQHIWLYHPEPLQCWYQEQQLTALGYPVQICADLKQLCQPTSDVIRLAPLTLRRQLSAAELENAFVWTCDESVWVDDLPATTVIWPTNQGMTVLSQRLYQILQQQSLRESQA